MQSENSTSRDPHTLLLDDMFLVPKRLKLLCKCFFFVNPDSDSPTLVVNAQIELSLQICTTSVLFAQLRFVVFDSFLRERKFAFIVLDDIPKLGVGGLQLPYHSNLTSAQSPKKSHVMPA